MSRTRSCSANTVPGDQLGGRSYVCTLRDSIVIFLLAFRPASAESLNAETARSFVVGRLFAFNCFDGSRGAGRIYDDGSVVGTIQFQGGGPVEWVSLRPGTLKVKGEAVCASLNYPPIEGCFNLNQIDDLSFRASISGQDFAYCDFTRRMTLTDRNPPAAFSLKATADE